MLKRKLTARFRRKAVCRLGPAKLDWLARFFGECKEERCRLLSAVIKQEIMKSLFRAILHLGHAKRDV